jgi:hypothetical protein
VIRNFLKFSGRAIATTIRATACILSVAMLLSFPTAQAHHFGQHFGTTEIRQNIVRHTFVAGPEAGGAEKIALIDAQPANPPAVTIDNGVKRYFPLEIVSEVPAFRLLQHFKLGPSRSGATDPLL